MQQPVVEPLDSLQKGLLLGKFLGLLTHVATDGKAVVSAAVQVDLVWLAGLLEDFLGLVALVVGEDFIGLGGGDGPRPPNSGKFLLVDKRRVSNEADVDAALVVAGNVL